MATLQRDGYTVLRRLLPPEVVDDFGARVDRYVQQRGPRLRRMADIGWSTRKDALYLPDVQSEPTLRPLFTECNRRLQSHTALTELFAPRPVRFLQRNEININHMLPWHRDGVQGELAAYTLALKPWSEQRGGHPIVGVALFLEDHHNDSMAMLIRRGSHKVAMADSNYGEEATVHTRRGDAIIFDTRAWHRSGKGGGGAGQRFARWQSARGHRKLLTLSYGAPSAFADAHERAMRMRNRLLSEPSLCNLSLGIAVRGVPPATAELQRACVRRAVQGELRRLRSTNRVAWRVHGDPRVWTVANASLTGKTGLL